MLNNFKPEEHFHTTKELIDNKILDISAQALTKPLNIDNNSSVLKNKYNRLGEYI